MTDEGFDKLTKVVSRNASRRSLIKGAAGVAFGGLLARFGGGAAEAQVNRQACNRLHQSCGAGQPACCAHLACHGGACCRPLNETCYADSDCCPDNVCRPNPHGMGNRCLPPGDVGADCVENADCMSGLACEQTTGQCGEICGVETCRPDQICDAYTSTCVGELGAPCADGSECVSGFCDPYTGVCEDIDPVFGACLFATCSDNTFPVCGADITGENDQCVCATTFAGDCACVANTCPSNDLSGSCTADSDCAPGYVCDVTCWPNYLPDNGFCIKACGFDAA